MSAFAKAVARSRYRGIHSTIGHADETRGTMSIFAPSFDHALKDPCFDAVEVTPLHRIVLIEDLYAFLSIKPYIQAGEMLDECWFVQIDSVEAARRLVKHRVITSVAKTRKKPFGDPNRNNVPRGL